MIQNTESPVPLTLLLTTYHSQGQRRVTTQEMLHNGIKGRGAPTLHVSANWCIRLKGRNHLVIRY